MKLILIIDVRIHYSTMNSVPSLIRLSAIKIAVILCNQNDFKKEILLVSGSVSHPRTFNDNIINVFNSSWLKKIDQKFRKRVEICGLPTVLLKKVMHYLKAVAMDMLCWCQYHREYFDLSPAFSVQFLSHHLFTTQGKLNMKEAAKLLVSDAKLSLAFRYRLACGYLLIDHICDLWNRMSDVDRGLFHHIWGPKYVQQPRLAILWTYYLLNKVEEILDLEECQQPACRQERNVIQNLPETFWKCVFQQSVEDGNVIAVKFAWEMLSMDVRERFLLRVATNLLETIGREHYDAELGVTFGNHVDVLCFLLSNMQDDEKTALLRREIQKTGYSETLTYLMEWHNGDLFLETQKIIVTFLSKETFAKTLLHFKGFPNWNSLRFFKEFWRRSPVDFKCYALNNKELLEHMIMFDEDMEVIKFIVEELPAEEKANVIFSDKDMRRKGLLLIEIFYDNYNICKWLIHHMKSFQFDRKLHLNNVLHYLAFNFRFISKSDIEIILELAQLCLDSDDFRRFARNFDNGLGEEICNILWTQHCHQDVENYLFWCCSFQETTGNFKEKLFRQYSVIIFYKLLMDRKLESVQIFLGWFDVADNTLRELKKQTVLKYLSDGQMFKDFSTQNKLLKLKLLGNKKPVPFLKWCLTDDDMIVEIRDKFKETYEKVNQMSDNRKTEMAFKRFEMLAKKLMMRKSEVVQTEFPQNMMC